MQRKGQSDGALSEQSGSFPGESQVPHLHESSGWRRRFVDTPLLGAQGFPCWICLPSDASASGTHSAGSCPLGFGRPATWSGRDLAGIQVAHIPHPCVSMPLGAEQRGEEGEGKGGVEFRECRGGYLGVHLLERPA